MKHTFIILSILFGQNFIYGQADSLKIRPKRNTVFLELAGQSIYYSVSYDRLYRIDKKVKTSINAGITIGRNTQAIPLSFNWLFGQRRSHLELGTGLTFWRDLFNLPDKDSYLYFTPKIAYRFQNPNGGLFFSFALTPTIGLIQNESEQNQPKTIFYFPKAYNPFQTLIFPWGGISLGYTF